MADYARLMDATWRALYASPAGRSQVLAQLPAAEAALLAAAMTEGFAQDAARRRSRISPDLLAAFPLTFRIYYGLDGAEAMNALLDSTEWVERDWLAGHTFPSPVGAAAAFAKFFAGPGGDRTRQRVPWVQDAFDYESALLGLAEPVRGVDRGADVLKLRPDARVAECTFDVEATLAELISRSAEVPWSEASYLVKPRPQLFVTVIVDAPAGGHRHYRVVEKAAESLRWAWSAEHETPADAAKLPAVIDAVIAGLLV